MERRAFFLIMVLAGQILAQRQQWYVETLEFAGNESISRQVLLSRMQLQPPDFFIRYRYTFSVLTDDIYRLERFYASRGYLNARVRIAQVVRDSSVQGVYIRLRIHEGVQTIVDSVAFTSNEIFSDSALLRFTLLKRNEPLDSLLYARSGGVIEDSLASRGHLLAEVEERIRFTDQRDTARVVYTIREGPLVLIGNVGIEGAGVVREEVVQRELMLENGSVLTSGRIARSVGRLYSTGLFDFVRIEPVDTASVPSELDTVVVPVRVQVQTADFFSLTTGGGYSSEDGLYATAEVSYDNLFGLGHRASASGRLSYDLVSAQLIYSYPWFLRMPLFADYLLYIERRDEAEFSGLFRGGLFSLSGRFNPLTRYRVWFRVENTVWIEGDTSVAEFPERLRGNSALVGVGVTRDTRDNVVSPGNGFFGIVEAELAGPGIPWSDKFVRTRADARGYYSPFDDRLTLLSSIFAGYVREYGGGGAGVPSRELFRVGDGVRLVRGYPNEAVMDGGRGGRLALVFTPLEVMFLIYEPLSGALFVDGGFIWSALESFDTRDVRWSVGAGFRLGLPIGLVRFDYGVRLDGDLDLGGRFHLGVGTAF
ncbi:MAG: outer membrane protein assembly factor [Chitinispirillaceae bacterium]